MNINATSMTLEVPCGNMEYLEMSPRMDGTLSFYLNHVFVIPPEMTLTSWTFRDLQVASEYAEVDDYKKAQLRFYRVLYQRACMKPNYQMPAIPTHHFISDVATIAIWSGVIQWRVSDQPYTGFGKVITIEHGVRCEARYDDFD